MTYKGVLPSGNILKFIDLFLTVKLEQYGNIDKQNKPPSADILPTWKGCYKIRTLSPIINRQRVITVKLAKFAKKINETKKPTISANFFVTSEKNSNGIRLQEWLEGIVL